MYDVANRLTSVNGQAYTWDNNGNLLSDGTRTFTYDAANRLKSVVTGGTTTTFAYNGDGDRVSQTLNGVVTNYVFDPTGLSQLLVETTNGQSNFYVPGLAQYQGGGWNYYLPDRLGSVRQLVNSSAAVQLTQSFDPFGNLLESKGNGQSNFGYTGEQSDSTGLLFLRARYYQPAIGRFLTPDPIVPEPVGSAGWNGYGYVGNNPIRYVDPSGHEQEPGAGFGGGRETWLRLAHYYEQAAITAGDSYRGTLQEYQAAQAGKYYNLYEGNLIAARSQDEIINNTVIANLLTIEYAKEQSEKREL